MKKKAIFVIINDSYSFAFGNLLVGLNKHFSSLEETDIICYEENISEKNKKALLSLNQNIIFNKLDDSLKSFSNNILNDKYVTKTRWGKYVLVKLEGFNLINTYEKVLFLDVDMLIQEDISPIFEYTNIAWRKIIAWSGKDVFKTVLDVNKQEIIACSSGCILFSKELRDYKIVPEDWEKAYLKIRNLKGGLDERLLTYLAYSKGITVNELPMSYNCPFMEKEVNQAKIIHFIDGTDDCKPWQDNMIALAFPEWIENNKAWIAAGGEKHLKPKLYETVQEKCIFVRRLPKLVKLYDHLLCSKAHLLKTCYKVVPCELSAILNNAKLTIKVWSTSYGIIIALDNCNTAQNIELSLKRLKTIVNFSLKRTENSADLILGVPEKNIFEVLDFILSLLNSKTQNEKRPIYEVFKDFFKKLIS